jgi:hypothetical protein|nr:MAG TPA: hypothetical protein [Crassvirales sp.]
MLCISTKEYTEGNRAIYSISITFFGITIYKSIRETTNNNVVSALTTKSRTTIKGFKNED